MAVGLARRPGLSAFGLRFDPDRSRLMVVRWSGLGVRGLASGRQVRGFALVRPSGQGERRKGREAS